MKKFISIVASLALCAVAFAQENGNRDAEGKIVRGPYTQASFFDNTFIEIQGGVSHISARDMGIGNLRIAPAAGVNLGKWFNPNFGLRLGWQGLSTTFKPVESSLNDVSPYNYTHADFLVNISNWFSGYKQTRVWDFVPYIHAGWVNTTVTGFNTLNKFGMGLGLYNKIRITDRVGLSLDIRTTAVDNLVMGETYCKYAEAKNGRDSFGEKLGYVSSALIGVNVNFGKAGWERVNPTVTASKGAAASGLNLGEYIGAAKKDAKLQALQAKADQVVASSKKSYEQAVAVYKKASEKVDADGNVLPTVYEGVDAELAKAYADMANFEECPDFTGMTRIEKATWDKSHKEILPEGWKKMKDAQKNQWILETIYAPAQNAIDEKEQAKHQLADARNEVKAAGKTCDEAIALSQTFVDDADRRLDANNNILAAAYPVEAALAQKYADIANTEACPDFTQMSKKQTRAWIKAHKDILPKEFKKLTAEQKNDWVVDNIYAAKFQAIADREAAAEELAKAQARKTVQLKNLEEANKSLDAIVESTGVGYFTIGKSVFNEKQLANWKKSIKAYDKTADYTVTGYADKETGTPALNAKLRKERSEYVAKLLKENGFTGTITPAPAAANEKFVNFPIWKNRSAVIK